MEEKYKVIIDNQEFNPSDYQIKIFKEIEKGKNNIIINATAGSSKTTTIVNSIRFIPEEKKILFVAFNKDIVSKIKKAVSHKNAKILTFHGLGYSILLENKIVKPSETASPEPGSINIYKYNNYINTNIDQISYLIRSGSLTDKKKLFIRNVKDLVEYSRDYIALTTKEIKKVADIYGITPIGDEFETVREILLWGKEHTETIDYKDMIWLPSVLNLNTKKYLFDRIFIDEAQDTSIAQQMLIEKCFKRGTKFVAVGDKQQQINIWAGSTMKSIENLKKKPNTIELPLSISYRCPKKVVELASKFSDNIMAAPNAIDGTIIYDASTSDPKDNDMVLCRTTAPIIALMLKYLRMNKKCFIRGSESIKENMVRVINTTNSVLIDKQCATSDGLIPKLYTDLINEIGRIRKDFNLTYEEATNHPTILEKYDIIQSIIALSDTLTTVEELIEKVNIIFNKDNTNGIQLSTIHKAKGLEADNVFILYPTLLNPTWAEKEWEKKCEKNLIYVAYTRAKNTLGFINENARNGYVKSIYGSNGISTELEKIKERLKFNSDMDITESNYKDKINVQKTVKLGENKISQPSKNQSGKVKGGQKFKNLL